MNQRTLFLLILGFFVNQTFSQNTGFGESTPTSRVHIKGSGSTSATSSLNVTNSSSSSLFYVRDDGKIGVGTTSPTENFHLLGKNFAVTGNLNIGDALSLSGAGTRMFFYPQKSAFRAGTVAANQWNDGSIGNYSVAMGQNTTASAPASTALGTGTSATNSYATALGANTTASGIYSTAMGYNTTANGQNTTAMGISTIASGQYATAMGSGTVASGITAIAMGQNVVASSYRETAIGSYNTIVSGYSTNSWVPTDRLFIIGNGVSAGTESDAFVILKNGNTTLKGALTLTNGTSSYTLPQVDGTLGQALVTNGSGGVAWGSPNPALTYISGAGIAITGNAISNTGDLSATNELELPTQTGNNGKYLTTDGSAVSWITPTPPTTYSAGTGIDVVGGVISNTGDLSATNELELPTQTGNNGKYLTTDGNAVSWITPTPPTTYSAGTGIDVVGGVISNTGDLSATNELELPTQTGNNGKYLTTDGTTASWITPTPPPTYSAGTGIDVVGGVISNTGDLSATNELELPTQTGNNGKYLTTDGNAVSWITPTPPITYSAGTGIDVVGGVISNTGDLSATNELELPTQTGNNGKYLTTDGNAVSWITPTPPPTYSAGTGIDVVGGVISNTGDLSATNELELPTQTGNNGKYLTTDGNAVSWITPTSPTTYSAGTGIDVVGGVISNTGDLSATNELELPAQMGNNGKYLTTDGSAVSWITPTPPPTYSAGTGIDVVGGVISNTGDLSATNELELPTQTGNNGKYLTTDGSTTSWVTPTPPTTYSAGTGIDVVGGIISNTGDLSATNELELPTQTGNNGKYLTTDGNAVSWVTPTPPTTYSAGTGIDVVGGVISNTGDLSATNELELPTQTGNNGKYLTTDGSTTSWVTPTPPTTYSAGTGIDVVGGIISNTGDLSATNELELPTQTGNNGKYLTTDGSAVSWITPTPPTTYSAGTGIDVVGGVISNTGDLSATNELELPTQTGNNGKYLTTDGTTTSWTEVVGGGGSLDYAYDFSGAGAGRTITADNGAVLVQGIDGLQVIGTLGSGTPLTLSGAGTRMFFYPKKGAFRAGNVSGTHWDDANIGSYSLGMGNSVKASGNTAVAMGSQTTASGTNSTAICFHTTSSGHASFSSGENTTASGATSTAMGQSTTASGANTTAMGQNTIASGANSTAMGQNTTASGAVSAAMGQSVKAEAYAEITIGMFSTQAATPNSGAYIATDRLFTIGNGIDNSNKSDALIMLKNGNTTLKGALTLTNGTSSFTLPQADGTTGQVLTTNGSGIISWVSPVIAPTYTAGTGISIVGGVISNTGDLSATNELELPAQTGNNGKYLTTNGTTTSWTGVVGGGGSLDYAYDFSGAGLGRTITADNGAVLVQGNDGLQVTGTYGIGAALSLSGTGSRMFFYPKKAAFRAGDPYGNDWDDANIGDYSFATGLATRASGAVSIAMGESSISSGAGATAIGISANAIGYGSVSIGQNTHANGNNSTSLGYGTIANTTSSTAIGVGAYASSTNSIAIGIYAKTNASYSIAIGNTTTADAYSETVIGAYNTVATSPNITNWILTDRLFTIGNGSSATTKSNAVVILKNGNIGMGTVAPTTPTMGLHLKNNNGLLVEGTYGSGNALSINGTGTRMFFYPQKAAFRAGGITGTLWDDANIGAYSIAMGGDTKATGAASVAMGGATTASADYATAMGAGSTASGVRATALGSVTTASGYASFASGEGSVAGAEKSTAMGVGSTTSGWASTAIGEAANASGWVSIALGSATTASGIYATATGRGTTASGNSSTAMGNATNASADYAIAMGRNAIASGLNATAMGFQTTASGSYATAIGWNTVASGDYAIAMGLTANASGLASFAIGANNVSSGRVSSSIGDGTNAAAYGEVSIGLFNTLGLSPNPNAWVATDRIFTVGNGTSSSAKSDAMVILKNGNVGVGNSTPSYKLHVNGAVAATSFVTTSDKRYKTNIKTLSSEHSSILAAIQKLNGYYYDFKIADFPQKNFSNTRQIGFIAQEIEEVFPEMVATDNQGYKAVDYNKMAPVLLEAIKELEAKNKALEATLAKERATFSAKIEALENAVYGNAKR